MLTKSQLKTLQFIERFIANKNYPPTAQEIAQGIGISSRGVVHRYLKALEAANMIALEPKRHRNISLLKSSPHNPNSLPLLGSIAAGAPIEAIGREESISLLDLFSGKNRYALRVKGDSMIDDGIFDGDMVICERTSTVDNGHIAVVLIDNQEATLKRIYTNLAEHNVRLEPSNQNMQAMTFAEERVVVQGEYIGLIRLR